MSANDTQVAGTHYRTGYQHWDLAADLKLGYFEGQITKYVTRHRTKNKLQDLEKAQHFAQKLFELASKTGQKPQHWFPTDEQIKEFVESNNLNIREYAIIKRVTTWVVPADISDVVNFLKMLIAQEYGDDGPGAGYVNQG